MPKQSCPCPPDNCFPECVKCAVEKCKKICCDRKYLKLAHKLLDSGLFVDSANYHKQEDYSARTSSQFYNITNAFADPLVIASDLEWMDMIGVDGGFGPIIHNNQPNNLISWGQLGFDAIDVKEFNLIQLTTFSILGGNFTFIMNPVLSLIFQVSFSPDGGYATLQEAITSATGTGVVPTNPQLLAYLNSLLISTSEVLKQVLPGGLPQVLIASDTPFITNVKFTVIDPTVSPAVTGPYVGKAGLVSKTVNSNSPCSTESAYFLVTAGRRVQDRHGPLPGPCDN